MEKYTIIDAAVYAQNQPEVVDLEMGEGGSFDDN